MYWCNDALGSWFNWLFFFIIIIVCAMIMLNLVLGVLSGKFGLERERILSRQKVAKDRSKEVTQSMFASYCEWIERGDVGGRWRQRRPEDDENYGKKQPIESVFEKVREEADEQSKKICFCINVKLLNRLRRKIRKACKTQLWFWTILSLVFLNTVAAAVEHADQPEWLDKFVKRAELAFLIFFSVEVAIKMFGLGFKRFFKSAFSVFDLIVIVGSFIELGVVQSTKNPIGLSALRALRLLKVFKVTRYWRQLKFLVLSLVGSIKSILSLLFLLFLFIFIFALLGMQLFGGKMIFEGEVKMREGVICRE